MVIRRSSGEVISNTGQKVVSTSSTSTGSGGISYDPYLRDAQGNPIGSRMPPAGSTPESIRRSYEDAASANRIRTDIPLSSRGLPESYIGDILVTQQPSFFKRISKAAET